MTDASDAGERSTSPSLDESDPELHYEEDEEESENQAREDSDTSSILSDDSVYPVYEHAASDKNDAAELTFYQCCISNNAMLLKQKLYSGVTRQEVMELDINGRNGLLVACFKGFVDIVTSLSKCRYVDINHQDNDGNTALMIAAQAGHITIVNYLLNYYPGLELEMRDFRGLTALMKAAVQGRNECVAALLLAGADLAAVDPVKGKTAREWAALTGRFETIVRIRTLLERPCAEQFSKKYLPEWPALPMLVAETLGSSRTKRLTNKIRSTFTINFPHDPEPDGVMDHMVRMTTCLASPFVGTACQTVCPDSPPEVGKQRLSVPEILKEYKPDPDAKSMASASSCNGQLMTPSRVLIPYQPSSTLVKIMSIPLRLRRNTIYPAGIPKIELTKSPGQSPPKEKKIKPDKNKLELPKWRYKELKEEKKKALEEAGKPKKSKGKSKRKK
ncbi:photoreceptor ankyrin repeat protein [Anolis carolinensis]|uniref:Ankyrin repeat domain 33 n=1 Tax=Anolis carolinensis TaxID=28377 RepID=G1KTA1_ANOCA|nr:PREDICTED: ankyrin repeat domain-containing protein 33 [Anolis carolinensis]|eukprot:XP_003217040.1 PREDICTED: ankyrin repeat domain-containing protein 33 [Anolis carolinensis]